jgi:uncharacterized protein YkwD
MSRTRKLVVAFSAGFVLAAGASTASARLTSTESSLLQAVNSARSGHGLARVSIDLRLTRIARAHSVDMLRHDYFAHGPFTTRIRACGAAGPIFGENLAWGPTSAPWVVGRWLASPEHRSILLRPGFRRVGIGALHGPFSGTTDALVVTADFAGS